MLPDRRDIPIWLTILIGIIAVLIVSLIASALGVGETRGIDWIKLIIQVALASTGGGPGRGPVRTWEKRSVAQAQSTGQEPA